MKIFQKFLVCPSLFSLLVPLAVYAGGDEHSNHKGHHDHHGTHTSKNEPLPSTMLMGKATYVLGGVEGATAMGGALQDKTTFNYDMKLMGMTSFTGKDMLKTAVRIGNFGMMDPFGMSGAARLDTAFNSNNQLDLHKLFYKFPLSEDIQITFGPRLRQDDLLGVWPSAYPSDEILFVLNNAGANDTYSKNMGAGASIVWSKDKLVATALLVAEDAADSTKGFLQGDSSDIITTQLALVDDSYTIALAYTHADNGNTTGNADADDYSSFGISGTYKFSNDSNVIPSSISGGIGWKSPDNEDNPDTSANSVESGNTWTVGVMWSDAFREGNNLGLAIGTSETHRDDSGYDNPLAWEAFYQVLLNDSMTITPAVFVIEKDGDEDVSGAIVKTIFNF